MKNKWKWILGYATLAFFSLTIMVLLYIKIASYEANRRIFTESVYNLGEYSEGDIITQQVPLKDSNVKLIRISFATFGSTVNEGELSMFLYDGDKTVGYRKVEIEDIADCSYLDLNIEGEVNAGDVVTLEIVIESLSDESKLTSFRTNYDNTKYNLTINGEIKPYEIGIHAVKDNHLEYIVLMIIMVMVLTCAVAMVPYVYIKRKWSLEKVFLIPAISLGIIYMILLPPLTVPDEEAHILTSYHISNVILGTDGISDTGKIDMRYCDTNADYRDRPYDEQIIDYLKGLFEIPTDNEKEMVQCSYGRTPLNSPRETYILSALGIVVGRVLGLSGELTLMLGRVFNYVVYVMAVYYAIKRIPVGKISLVVVSALPMMVQQSISYSYDSLMLAMIITFVSYFCLLMQNKELRKRDVILLAFTCAVLSRVKGKAYLPIALLIVIPLFKNRKEWIKKKIWYYIGMVVVSIVVFFIIDKLTKVNLPNTSTDVPYYTLSYALQHPRATLMLLYNTVFEKFDFYIYTMMGYSLSHFDIYMPSFVALGYLTLLFLSTIPEKEENTLGKVTKMVTVLMALVSVVGVMYALTVGFTTIADRRIEGVQGRYFLPPLILLMITLRNNRIQMKKNMNNMLVVSSLVLQFFALCSIIVYYLR